MEQNSKNLWMIVGVVVVLILGFVWWQDGKSDSEIANQEVKTEETVKTETPAVTTKTTSTAKTGSTQLPSVTKDGIYLIYYISSGFSPRSIEIPVGKSVRFVNSSSGKSMRIESTNTSNPIYNSFNQSKTVGAGGTYEYTFTDKGTFTYINKNNPTDYGAIIVK